METIRKVFCATDFSEPADEAIRQGDALARTYNAELIVYHALPSPLGSHPLLPVIDQQALSDLPALQARLLDALLDRAQAVTGRGADAVKVQLGEGAPYAAIVSRAEAASADVIVIGGQGASGVKRLLLGNVAEKVVRYAHCPVLIARSGPATGKIIVGTDFSDPAMPAVAAAAREAQTRKGRVTIVHSLNLPEPVGGTLSSELVQPAGVLNGVPKDQLIALAKQRMQEAAARFKLDADLVVTEGAPAIDIPRLAEELPAELVIVATSGRTGLKRVMLGSVAEAVVRAVPCSALVVRLKTAS